ncbi:hypothetical protein Bca52824_016898 [Brassica carinata]|uniref:Uncharacterized protein n=1 Tax=Brassica carinata TaxID=52824 RepID=A0A8X7VM46_BRACI|nr:hypothetical protein Bca52824_016898 [Brassica carinata]
MGCHGSGLAGHGGPWVCGLDKRARRVGLQYGLVFDQPKEEGQLPAALGSRFATIFPKENSAKLVTERNRERDREIGQRLGCECVWVNPTRSWLVWCGDRVMMSTRGKEKDVDKGLSTPERTPKDLTRTVARPRSHEDQAVYGCVGCVSIV